MGSGPSMLLKRIEEGKGNTDIEVDRLFAMLDLDHDGVLSGGEYERFFREAGNYMVQRIDADALKPMPKSFASEEELYVFLTNLFCKAGLTENTAYSRDAVQAWLRRRFDASGQGWISQPVLAFNLKPTLDCIFGWVLIKRHGHRHRKHAHGARGGRHAVGRGHEVLHLEAQAEFPGVAAPLGGMEQEFYNEEYYVQNDL
eukprot:RCo036688